MISKYLNSKNIINQILPIIDEEELKLNTSINGYYLNIEDQSVSYYQFHDSFTDYELDKIIMLCNKLPHLDGSIDNNRIDSNYRKSTISWVPINNQTSWLYKKITEYVISANKQYFKYDLTKIEQLQFTRYSGKEGEFYSPHLDSKTGYSYDNRKLTFVLQLSNLNDYDGGELRLYTSKDPHPIKKIRGLLTFFPSHTLHECTPVTSGERYTLVGWVCGPRIK